MTAVLPSEYIYPVKLDWRRIFFDLIHAGISKRRAAMLLGVPRTTLEYWAGGRGEPDYTRGEAILRLHRRTCGDELTNLRQREGTADV